MTTPRDISAVHASLESLTRSFASELAELKLSQERIKLAASAVVKAKDGSETEFRLAASLLVAAVLGPESVQSKVGIVIPDCARCRNTGKVPSLYFKTPDRCDCGHGSLLSSEELSRMS